jgi:hypothetical protein
MQVGVGGRVWGGAAVVTASKGTCNNFLVEAYMYVARCSRH